MYRSNPSKRQRNSAWRLDRSMHIYLYSMQHPDVTVFKAFKTLHNEGVF